MTLDEFIVKYNGQYIEVAGSSAKNQCVDLANAYIRDVLWLPIVPNCDAKDFPTRVSSEDYEWILFFDGNTPQYGDIVIWGTGVGESGHIDVCIDKRANTHGFGGFDQNWPRGYPCKPVGHNYAHVHGWLRPKKNNPNNDMTAEQESKLNEVYEFMQDVKTGAKALRMRETDGALFADSEILGKPAEELKRTIWADSQALAIIMRGARAPIISEEESKKSKYVRVQSARQFDDKK